MSGKNYCDTCGRRGRAEQTKSIIAWRVTCELKQGVGTFKQRGRSTYTVRITASLVRSELDIVWTTVGEAAYVRRNQWPCVCHCLCLRLRVAV